MQVRHPAAVREAAVPAAVTVDTDTYPVGSDGVVNCPDGVATRLVEQFATRDGVTREDVVYEEDGPPDTTCGVNGCSRSVDAPGETCWQHDATED